MKPGPAKIAYDKAYYKKYKKRILKEAQEAYRHWKNSFTAEEFFQMNRRHVLKYRYNLTPEEVKKLWRKQKCRCKLCRKRVNKFVVDHDHDCCSGRRSCGKCIRGLLCIPCNAMLGQLVRMQKIGFKKIQKYLRRIHDLAIRSTFLPSTRAVKTG